MFKVGGLTDDNHVLWGRVATKHKGYFASEKIGG